MRCLFNKKTTMTLGEKSKLLKLVEKEIIVADNRFDFQEVESLVHIVEFTLGFKTKANELKQQYL